MSRTSPPSPLSGRSWGHRLLGSVQAGLLGILLLGPDVLTTFVLNYARQWNQPSPPTQASAQ